MSYTPAKHFESDLYNPHSNYNHGSRMKSSRTPHGSCILKVAKLVINIIVLILYRIGAQGKFLGVGGTWNLNEEKNPDSEIVASGIFVGYFIYTSLAVISFCLELRRKGDDDDSFDDDDDLPNDNSIVVDLLMSFVGTFMWVAVGGTCLHYWNDYQNESMYIETASEKKFGIAVGSLCIVQGAVFLVDTILAFRIHWEQNQ